MKNKPGIIGIAGKGRHGKGTAARFIKDHLVSIGYNVSLSAFSDVIREACAKTASIKHHIDCNTTLSWMTDNEHKDKHNNILGCSPRAIMQRYGNSKRAKYGPDYFVKLFMSNVETQMSEYDFVINESVRFDSEIEAIESAGGVILKVFNPYIQIPLSDDLTENGISSSIKFEVKNTYHDGSENAGENFKLECDSISMKILSHMNIHGAKQQNQDLHPSEVGMC